MRMIDIDLKKQLENLKNNQVVRYTSYDIPVKYIERTFDDIVKVYTDQADIIHEHDKVMRKYILEQITIDNRKVIKAIIDNNYTVKTIIVKNPRYGYQKSVIEKVYEKAVLLLKYRFNINDGIGINILSNMKYIIDNNYINTDIKKMNIRIYDISFLEEYINMININKEEIAKILEITIDDLNLLLSGDKKATIDEIESLCIYFDVNDINELKNKIEKDIKYRKKINIEEIKEKLKEEPKKEEPKSFKIKNEEKYYNLSFMKEYVELYKIRKDNLAALFSCGIKKVDEILNGTIWVKESIMIDVYVEYRVKNFSEFKEKILNYIKKYKLNELKNKLREFSDKYRSLKITEESLVDLMPKELLSLALDIDNMDEIDRKISKLLFKIGFDREYTYKDICMILEVDEQRVTKLYKENLKKVINLLKESQDNIYILKASN